MSKIVPRLFTELPALAENHRDKKSQEGAPLLRQVDGRWGRDKLEKKKTIAQSGCALTATAMALALLSKKDVNPKDLDHHLDTHAGYKDDGLYWDIAAGYAGADCSYVYTFAEIDQELAAGRSVVAGVTYKKGSNGGANGTDHWILLIGKRSDTRGTYYRAIDPMTGRVILMRLKDGKLRAEARDSTGRTIAWRYKSTDQWRAFKPLDHQPR
jgi:hypothetical protein